MQEGIYGCFGKYFCSIPKMKHICVVLGSPIFCEQQKNAEKAELAFWRRISDFSAKNQRFAGFFHTISADYKSIVKRKKEQFRSKCTARGWAEIESVPA